MPVRTRVNALLFSVALVFMLLIVASAIHAPYASAAVAPAATYVGWAAVDTAGGREWADAWRWDAQTRSWTQSYRWSRAIVYMQPYAEGWKWTWTSSTGWLAMRTSQLSVDTDAQRRCGVEANLVPTCGAWIGTSVDSAGTTWAAAIAKHEQDIGRADTTSSRQDGLDIVHTYKLWREEFPNVEERKQSAQGKILFINWKGDTTRTAAGQIPWATIASGAEDAQIIKQCTVLKNFGRRLFVTFYHEPEDQVGDGVHGTTTDYRNAFRRVVKTCDTAGASNVVWVWNVMGYSGHFSKYPTLYPGDDVVDWIGLDSYNVIGCSKWISFTEMVRPFYDLATQSGWTKPMMLAEWGACTDARQGEWFRSVRREIESGAFPRLKAFVYFDHSAWLFRNDATTLAGYSHLAASPWFRQIRP